MARKAVFDIDDILWGLNERVSSLTGIDVQKMVRFYVPENDALTESEKRAVMDAYKDPRTFEDMKLYKGVERLRVLEGYGFQVHIQSNKFSKETADIQKGILMEATKLPEERFHMHIIEGEGAKKKEPLEDVFILADDSPHNLASLIATHKLTINHPWNTSSYGRELLKGIHVRRFDEFEDLMNHAVLLCYHEYEAEKQRGELDYER